VTSPAREVPVEVKVWVVEFSHSFPKEFKVEEDMEDGSTAPFTSLLLEDLCSQS
jgi:hypothetical protein